MEANGVHTNGASGWGALAWLEGHALCTTALSVLEDLTASRARVGFHTSGSVRHAVVAVDCCVVGGRDIHCVDREGIARIARHRWLIVKAAGDAFALELTLGQEITLAEGVGAAEAGEGVAAVGADGLASREAAPVITAGLRGRAVVVGIAWAREGRSISPSCCCCLLGNEPCNSERCRLVMHVDCLVVTRERDIKLCRCSETSVQRKRVTLQW